MTFILFLILAIVVFAVMLILSFVKGVSTLLFGKSSYSAHNRYGSANQKQWYQKSESHTSESNEKIFSKDEGEYVPYEEIKE
ncbi:MAG: DUF4834 family protein [Dysgonomonas sp.]